jgi:hypothetical protein
MTLQDTYDHIKRNGSSVMLSLIFGHRAPRSTSPIVTDIFNIGRRIFAIYMPGATPPLDLFPWLQWVPKRFARWKTTCEEIRMDQRTLYMNLVSEADARLKKGYGNGCYMETILKLEDSYQLNREQTW